MFLSILLIAGFMVLPMPQSVVLGEGLCHHPDKVQCVWCDKIVPEGYRIDVRTNGVLISYSDAAGEFYARMTLQQLKESDEVPVCVIEDAPAYAWRGLHLDEARHFFGKAAVKRFLDRMARLKLNVFHWHLTDHQGWRLQLDSCPEVAEKAAVRNVAEWKRLRTAGWTDPDQDVYGPYSYTKADVREIVAYAAARHITVVPEIEIPGHCRALLKACPELACENVGDKLDVVEDGYRCAVVCAGNDRVLSFYKDVLDEVCELFPSKVIHLGGDEVRKDFWKACSRCQTRIRNEKLKDEMELQSWLMGELSAHLAEKGRRMIGWDEILDGNVRDDSVVMSWRGEESTAAAARAGYDVVACPEEFCYFDFPQGLSDDPHEYHPKGVRFFPPVSARKVYSFDPRAGLPHGQQSRVIGAQANNWTELTLDEAALDWKVWMRAAALAEALWTSPKERNFDAFVPRLEYFRRRLLKEGANPAPLEFVGAETDGLERMADDATAHGSSMMNPIFGGWYADPQLRQYGGAYWIFPTYSHNFEEQTFIDVFSSSDLKTWTKHPRAVDAKDFSWVCGAMWAPDAHEKDGRFYIFFAANDPYPVGGRQTDGEPQREWGIGKHGGIGVAVAEHPEGPYRDLLGKPLVDQFWNGAQPIDQYVFRYDGGWYMLYGGWGKCNLVRVSDDFKSLVAFADGSMWRDLTPPEYTEGSVMFERRGIWYFMYSSGNWTDGSYCVKYCTAKTPFGPFDYKGCVLSSQLPLATGAGHHSVLNVSNTDDWYICYHRRPIPNESPHHRVTCMERMYFNADGSIRPVIMTDGAGRGD